MYLGLKILFLGVLQMGSPLPRGCPELSCLDPGCPAEERVYWEVTEKGCPGCPVCSRRFCQSLVPYDCPTLQCPIETQTGTVTNVGEVLCESCPLCVEEDRRHEETDLGPPRSRTTTDDSHEPGEPDSLNIITNFDNSTNIPTSGVLRTNTPDETSGDLLDALLGDKEKSVDDEKSIENLVNYAPGGKDNNVASAERKRELAKILVSLASGGHTTNLTNSRRRSERRANVRSCNEPIPDLAHRLCDKEVDFNKDYWCLQIQDNPEHFSYLNCCPVIDECEPCERSRPRMVPNCEFIGNCFCPICPCCRAQADGRGCEDGEVKSYTG